MGFISDLFNALFTYPIFNVLLLLYRLLSDMGLAIAALTGIVFAITLPLTMKQLRYTQRTQELRPKVEEIKRRHAGDQQAQLAAQQALYKAHGLSIVPPIIPTLIPTVVLSGLFFALNFVLNKASLATINRIMYPFLAHITNFTTLPDINLTWFMVLNTAWHISLGAPDPTHILPLLTGIMTFIQMRIAQPAGQSGEVISQAAQVMQWVWPLLLVGITIFFTWQFAAGVALYRLVWVALSAVQRCLVSGWGSLWVMPNFAVSAQVSGSAAVVQSGTTKRHRSSGAARRRGRNNRRRGKR